MPSIDVSFNGHLPNCVCDQCGLARLGAESIRKTTRKEMKKLTKGEKC